MILLNEAIQNSLSKYSSEDVFGYKQTPSGLHFWVIDGATPIAKNPMQYKHNISDSAWFVQEISKEITHAISFNPLTQQSIFSILKRVRSKYLKKCNHVEPYDYPLAAAVYIYLKSKNDTISVSIINYADCFFLLSNYTQITNKIILSTTPPPITFKFKGAEKGFMNFENDILTKLRKRRFAQNINGVGSALTLDPKSAFRGKQHTLLLKKPNLILIGSDGFERLWNSYQCRSIQDVFNSAKLGNLLKEMEFLRNWEYKANQSIKELKNSDDATVLSIFTNPSKKQIALSEFKYKKIITKSTIYIKRL